MTNDDAIATTESAEQRIDRATDAIRGMSHDLANEVSVASDMARRGKRGDAWSSHPGLAYCIPDRGHPSAPMRR